MTLGALETETRRALVGALGPAEGRAASRLVMEDSAGFSPVKIATRPELTLEPETVERVRRCVERIAAGYPPQYVVGRARFMGLDLEVTPAVLIPRPETAGLVDIITDDAGQRPDLAVLDAGSGSGCIALALARALPFSRVTAVDISPDALEIARRNADANGIDLDLQKADILHMSAPDAPLYDIIVSNPPYIPEHERDEVEASVARYEPAGALFVPDSDPLVFYRALARYAARALRPGGRLYFEINPHYAQGVCELMTAAGLLDVEALRDAFGKLRYARGRR